MSAIVSFVQIRRSVPASEDSRAAIVAGLAAGFLTTSTSTNGPPLAIYLAARRMSPTVVRDTVSVLFFVLDLVGLAALVAIVGFDPVTARASWLPVLAAVVVLGHRFGRKTFLLLPTALYNHAVRAVALAAGLATLAFALR